jgi:hypothetical protein
LLRPWDIRCGRQCSFGLTHVCHTSKISS